MKFQVKESAVLPQQVLKSYSFKYGDNEQKSTIKGFTFNHENNNLLNHDSLRKIVKKQIKEITIVNENKITRKNREIVNKYCEKVFKFGYDKRVIKKSMKITLTHYLMVTKINHRLMRHFVPHITWHFGLCSFY